MQTAKLDTNALFTQYVNVVNRAIGEHKSSFPFKQLLAVGGKLIGDKQLGVAVYKTDPDAPHDWFTLSFNDGKFRAKHGKHTPDFAWRVKEEHLRNVVSDPEPFVNSPAKLDLDWLVTRLELSR